MDCAPITIGDDVSIGPRAQLLTALHPIADHEARRQRWETAAPIVIGDNVWLGGGVIVCAGVPIGADTVVRHRREQLPRQHRRLRETRSLTHAWRIRTATRDGCATRAR
jgi:serine acetyltransferase